MATQRASSDFREVAVFFPCLYLLLHTAATQQDHNPSVKVAFYKWTHGMIGTCLSNLTVPTGNVCAKVIAACCSQLLSSKN